MLFLDIYLSSLSADDYIKIKHKLVPNATRFPLLNWGLLQNDISVKARNSNADLNKLQELATKFQWNANIESIVNQKYDAIVVSDSNQIIYWVNDGFTNMTGYTSEFAIGRTPKFLQGSNTSVAARKNIREHIIAGEIVTESIINYRKNKEEYHCRVQVIPIRNRQKEVTHFIAFEKEIA